MSRRHGASLRGTILLGIGSMPVIFCATFFGLVYVADAMAGGNLPRWEQVLQGLLDTAGLGPASSPSAPPPSYPGPSPSPFQPLPMQGAAATGLTPPTAFPTLTVTPSATVTPSSTVTPTPTSSPSSTATPSPTSTPSSTPTATRTATPPPTRTPTRTATRTATQPPSPTASATPEATPTAGEATATPEVQPTEAGSTATATLAPTASTCDAAADASVEAKVIDLINTERVSQALAAYTVDSRLTAAARIHAADMACNHFTSHTGSDGSTVRDRVEAQGYAWSWIGENYYVTSDTRNGAQVAFTWWMNSTPHRNNLLSPNYTECGVGYVYDADSDYGGYFVVVFARPQ